MTIRIIIQLIMLIILIALASGLVFLVRGSKGNNSLVKALSVRIGLSVTLFIFLFLAFHFHWIAPHSLAR